MKKLQGVKVRKVHSTSTVYQDMFSIDEKILYTKSLKEKQMLQATEPQPLEMKKEKKVKE